MKRPTSLRVFIDADVLIAAAATPSASSASLVLLSLSELTLIDAHCSEQVLIEAERNLDEKSPAALPVFRRLVSHGLQVVPDPEPKRVQARTGLAHWKDLPILVAAAESHCSLLATFNLRHFQPGLPEVEVLEPGSIISRIREQLVHLD